MLHFPSDGRPGHTGFHLSNAHHQQGQPANQDMGTDTIILAVIHRSKIKRALKRPKSTLNFQQLLISTSDVFSAEALIAAA